MLAVASLGEGVTPIAVYQESADEQCHADFQDLSVRGSKAPLDPTPAIAVHDPALH